jgi:hypothetical protein
MPLRYFQRLDFRLYSFIFQFHDLSQAPIDFASRQIDAADISAFASPPAFALSY